MCMQKINKSEDIVPLNTRIETYCAFFFVKKRGKSKIEYHLCLHLKLTLWSEISFQYLR